jgi:hypothetical protein
MLKSFMCDDMIHVCVMCDNMIRVCVCVNRIINAQEHHL